MKKITLCALVLGWALVSTAATPKTFSGEAQKIQEQLEKLFDASKQVNASGPERKAARDKIENAMEWEQVAKDCLGLKEWNKTSAANRNTYRDLLRDVVVKTAFTRLDKFWDGAKYSFTDIKVTGNKAQATAKYVVKGDDFSLDYYLMKKGNGWTIYDIAFEEIRYSENIREQITSFLKDKGFPNLIDKLKKRRQELDEGKTAKAPTAKKTANG